MARYIDADKVHQFVDTKVAEGKDGWSKGVPYEWAYALTIIDNAPTADVAPRAEFDEVVRKLECLLCHATGGKLSKHTYDLMTMEAVVTDYIQEAYDEGYAWAKSELAREIFEEIRGILNKHYYACYQNEDGDECDAVISYLSYVAVDFDRLEKKYTGEP